MLSRLLTVLFYTVLGIILLVFIFSNREPVTLVMFPFGSIADLPLFVALSLMFGLGLLIGLSYCALLSMKHATRARRDRRAIAQLEQELAARQDASLTAKPGT